MIRGQWVSWVAAVAIFAPSQGAAQGYDCLMDPAEIIALGSPVSGVLQEVLVRRGEAVEKGQIVARLNSQIEESTVDLLEVRANSTAVVDAQAAQLAVIEVRYGRIAELHERGLVTEERFNTVEAELIAARSLLFQAQLNSELAAKELERARVALELRTLRSPIEGIVSTQILSRGEYVGSDDHIIEIVQLDPLKIEAFLPVSLFGSIKVGDTATVRPVAPLDGAYQATVAVIDRVFDAASGTFVVQLDLPNPNQSLPAGYRCLLTLGDG